MSIATTDVARSTGMFLRGQAAIYHASAQPYIDALVTFIGGGQYIASRVYPTWNMPRRAVVVSRRPGFGPVDTDQAPWSERENVRIRLYGKTPEDIVTMAGYVAYAIHPPTGGEGWTAAGTRIVSIVGPTMPGEPIVDPDYEGALYGDMNMTVFRNYVAVVV